MPQANNSFFATADDLGVNAFVRTSRNVIWQRQKPYKALVYEPLALKR